MKTITILLSFAVNDHNIVHLADYQTSFTDCYQAEQAALNQALVDYVDTGKAHKVAIESCEPQVAVDKLADVGDVVSYSLPLTMTSQ